MGYIVETEEKIKELFQDINYPEFDKFKEVVVATDVHTTSYVPISNIQIPRPKKYDLFVDGQWKRSCSNLNEKIPVECPNKSPLYYEELSREFSIQDLIDRPERHEGVVLDTVQERVVVNTDDWGKPKEKEVFLTISPEESKDYFIRNPQKLLVILVSSNTRKEVKVFRQRLLVITLSGNEIAALKKNDGINVVTTERSIYKVKKCQLVEEDELHVEVEPRELPSPPPADELKVKVIFPEDKDLGGISYVDLQAKNCINNQDVFSVSNLLLKRSSEKEGYNGMFKIRAKNVPPCDFYLKCSIKNEVWKTGEIKPNQKSVTVTFVKIHRPFTDRYRKPLVCVLVTMMALVLGGLSFVLYNKLSNDDKQGVAGQGDFTEERIVLFLHDVDCLLTNKDLKFVTVDSLYKIYDKNKKAIDEYSQSQVDNRNICQRLCEYKKVIEFIKNGNAESIKSVVDDKNCKLNQDHWNMLEQIVTNKSSKDIFKDKYEKLSRMGLKFESFCQIAELYGNCVGYEETDTVVASPEDKQDFRTGQKKDDISQSAQETKGKR